MPKGDEAPGTAPDIDSRVPARNLITCGAYFPMSGSSHRYVFVFGFGEGTKHPGQRRQLGRAPAPSLGAVLAATCAAVSAPSSMRSGGDEQGWVARRLRRRRCGRLAQPARPDSEHLDRPGLTRIGPGHHRHGHGHGHRRLPGCRGSGLAHRCLCRPRPEPRSGPLAGPTTPWVAPPRLSGPSSRSAGTCG